MKKIPAPTRGATRTRNAKRKPNTAPELCSVPSRTPVKSQMPMTTPSVKPAMVRIDPMRRPDDDMVPAFSSVCSDLSGEVYARSQGTLGQVLCRTERCRPVDESEQDIAATRQLAIDRGRSGPGADAASNLLDLDFDAQRVSRFDLALETNVVNTREKRELASVFRR